MTSLGGDLPTGSSVSYAFGLNNATQVVGRGNTTEGDRAFVWTASTGMQNLGTWPGGYGSYAYGLNNHGEVVGHFTLGGQHRAFIWTAATGMQDLNVLADAEAAGWLLLEAYDINDNGWIVGYGMNPAEGLQGFLLRPASLLLGDLAPAGASSFFNLGSILSGLLFSFLFSQLKREPIIGMAIGTLIGGLLHMAVQLPALRRQGFVFTPHLNFHDQGLRRIIKLMIPAVIGLSATQINLFVNTFFASSCVEGSVSLLNYAFRLIFFPIGMVGVSLSIATLPVISEQASRGNREELKSAYVSSTVLSLLLTVPASAGLMCLCQPIVRIIFEHGRFTAHDTPDDRPGPYILLSGSGLGRWFDGYNQERPHQALGYATPAEVYYDPGAHGAQPARWEAMRSQGSRPDRKT